MIDLVGVPLLQLAGAVEIEGEVESDENEKSCEHKALALIRLHIVKDVGVVAYFLRHISPEAEDS